MSNEKKVLCAFVYTKEIEGGHLIAYSGVKILLEKEHVILEDNPMYTFPKKIQKMIEENSTSYNNVVAIPIIAYGDSWAVVPRNFIKQSGLNNHYQPGDVHDPSFEENHVTGSSLNNEFAWIPHRGVAYVAETKRINKNGVSLLTGKFD